MISNHIWLFFLKPSVSVFSVFLSFLFLTSCIGATLGGVRLPPEETYTRDFAGMEGEAVIARYGPPDSSFRLDNGMRVIQYKSMVHRVAKNGKRRAITCTLRFWHKTTTILFVDYLGDAEACDYFLTFSRRDEPHN